MNQERNLGKIPNVSKVIVIYTPLSNHEITGPGLAGLFEYVCGLSLNSIVTKYICSLLRIFKIARQTLRSHDLITEYK